MSTWQERHKPLPKIRCEVRGCYSEPYMIIEDSTGNKHPACEGHLNLVAQKYMGPNDCLAI